MIYNKYIFLSICLLFFCFLSSCSHNKNNYEKDEVIVAKIGNSVITVDEFRKNYELGFSNLKTGDNPKRSYLEYMINEKLFMLEGYNYRLDETERVEKSIEVLERELLIEYLIEKEVKNKITVTNQEIRESFNKAKVSFKFRYWYESTFDKAKKVSADMKERGYAEVVEEILMNNPEYKIDPKYFETDYMNYAQISPELLVAIRDLPYGEISDPVELNDKYYIFQVLDIRRNSITENEYKSEAPSIEQVIFYKKFENELVKYGTRLLDPKAIKTKGKSFNLLADAILEWKNIFKDDRISFIEMMTNNNQNYPATVALNNNLSEPFFEYDEGIVTINEFVQIFNTSKFLREFESKKQFLNYLHSKVAQSIRDYFLIKEAKSKEVYKLPQLQKELETWKNKRIYEEYRQKLIKDSFDNKNKTIMNLDTFIKTKIENLKNLYKIEIYDAILDTITVIDFKKSKWASMQIFRYGTNKPVFPVADPRWNPTNN